MRRTIDKVLWGVTVMAVVAAAVAYRHLQEQIGTAGPTTRGVSQFEAFHQLDMPSTLPSDAVVTTPRQALRLAERLCAALNVELQNERTPEIRFIKGHFEVKFPRNNEAGVYGTPYDVIVYINAETGAVTTMKF